MRPIIHRYDPDRSLAEYQGHAQLKLLIKMKQRDKRAEAAQQTLDILDKGCMFVLNSISIKLLN